MPKRKLGNFQIIKLSSKRLKRKNYKLDISYEDAIRNNEVVKLGQNSLCESVQRLLGKPIDFPYLERLELKKKQISKRNNSDINRDSLKEIGQEIQDLTFIPELLIIEFSDKRHYKNIVDNGLYINGVEFVRILASAANIRRNSVFFVSKPISTELKELLSVGRNPNVKLIPTKISSYMGLHGTASYPVSFPKFAVIPNYEFTRMAEMSWINDGGIISRVNKEIEISAFDGQGIISPSLSKRWAEELGLTHIPSTMILRAPFIKGQVATFDFVKLAKELGASDGVDIWGNSFIIEEQELILSASQFKLGSESYDSVGHYIEEVATRDFGFRVSRYSQKEMRRDTTLNYMFIQSVDLDDDAIDEIVSDTSKYFKDIELEDPLKTSLYLSGSTVFSPDFNEEGFADLDILTKAILAFSPLLTESYISQRIKNVIKKKERQAKLGKLYVEGCYAPLVSDVYAQVEWMCGDKNPRGLLSEFESYSEFWNNVGVNEVACGRSPLTHSSEMMAHTLVSTREMEEWYKYQETSYIFNIHGLDAIYAASGDFDGDLLWSSNSIPIIQSRIPDIPISYPTGLAEKIIVSDDDIITADINGMGSKIGVITNISSFYHTLKYEYELGSPERNESDDRLKYFRKSQGAEIDRAKHGDSIAPVPSSWTQYSKGLSQLEKELLADRRPYFMRYNYSGYDKKYKDERDKYNKLTWSYFGKSFQDILDSDNRTKEEQAVIDKYSRYSFFLFTPSPMNKASWKMENILDEIHKSISSKKFDYTRLFSKSSFILDETILKEIEKLYVQYRSVKMAWRKTQNKNIKKDIYSIIAKIRSDAEEKISSNAEELSNHAIQLMIENKKTHGFVWDVFGHTIVEGLLDRYGHQIDILIQDDYGTEEFLYKKYSKGSVFV